MSPSSNDVTEFHWKFCHTNLQVECHVMIDGLMHFGLDQISFVVQGAAWY
jgi:hypothetical protein